MLLYECSCRTVSEGIDSFSPAVVLFHVTKENQAVTRIAVDLILNFTYKETVKLQIAFQLSILFQAIFMDAES